MNSKVKKYAYIAMFAAVNFAAFTYGKINIPTAAGGHTAIHIANGVVVLSALLLGPVEGGLAGAIGLSLADVLDPRYITSAPKTFFLKFMIGFIAGKVFQKIGGKEATEKKDIVKKTALSAACGLGFNVIFDPIIGYLFKRYILRVGAEASKIILTWTAGVTTLNAVICLILVVPLYLALYKSFNTISKN